jgi:hypothetical protein
VNDPRTASVHEEPQIAAASHSSASEVVYWNATEYGRHATT